MQRIENLANKGLMKIVEGSREFQYIEKGFLKGMELLGHVTTVVALHKNNVSNSCLVRQARLDSFVIFSKAVAVKCGGDANVKCAWYGGSLDELVEIVSTGFTGSNIHVEDDDSHGVGISLFPANFSIDSAMSTVEDEHGLRHVVLCRVILGKIEAVPSGSKQSQPSCKHYDTGVDDISAPRKHIIWTAFMNSHIHPEYILTFKYNYMKDPEIFGALKPQSQYVSFPNLVARVSNHLKPSQMSLLLKIYRVYQEQKITRQVWINKVRVIVGDRLLHSVITDNWASGLPSKKRIRLGVECWTKVQTMGVFSRLERPIGIWKNEVIMATKKAIHSVSGIVAWLLEDDIGAEFYYNVLDYEESFIPFPNAEELADPIESQGFLLI